MKNITALILCCAFVLAQYARQATYLQCRLVNYFNLPTRQCDCEKLPGMDKATVEFPVAPLTHNHLHVDESYCISINPVHRIFSPDSCIDFGHMPPAFLKDGCFGPIDHPPQFA